MEVIDCRNFRELLDSYLSEELSVESNHAMLRHTEMCAGCRSEMAARRRLRVVLKRACSHDRLSDEAGQRLLACLRSEAGSGRQGWKRRILRFFEAQRMLPVAVALLAVVMVGLGAWLAGAFGNGASGSLPEAALSAALFDEAAGDHKHCGLKFAELSGPFEMPESAAAYDPSYARLEKIAAPGAEGLELRTSHLCGYGGRKFAHLVYARKEHLISLLVTERDGRALELNRLPTDDGLPAGLQQGKRENMSIGAYQTSRHVVVVVSDLAPEENIAVMERLATPVTEHLRRFERQVAIIGYLGRRH